MANGWGAELDPEAVNDLLAIEDGPTRDLIIGLFRGDELIPDSMDDEPMPASALDDDDVGERLQDLPDPRGGWSWLRVDGYMVLYKPMTPEERADRGRPGPPKGGLADVIVAAIRPLSEWADYFIW